MDVIKALLLGIVEGLTEFLPISSTFHLLFVGEILRLPLTEYTKLFEIFIQSGAILAVVWLYRREIFSRHGLVVKTMVAFAPTALLGVILYRPIKNIFMEEKTGQIFIFILMGCLFLFFEFLVRRGWLKLAKSLASLSLVEALLIGSFQALSSFPGVSRAGAVILVMMVLGYRRAEAAFFSFLLAIPTLGSAALYDLYQSRGSLESFSQHVFPLSLGFIVSFLVAMVAVRWFIRYLQAHSLSLFAFYRFLVGGCALLWLFLGR